MAKATLADLITRSFRMADTPEPSNSTDGFVKLPEIVEIINEGAADLHELITDAYQDYFLTSTNLSVANSDRSVLLPDDFLKLRKLFMFDGADRYELTPMNLDELAGTSTTSTVSYPRYKLGGNSLHFSNGFDSARTLELWYIKRFKKITDNKETLTPEIPDGFERYIVGYAAAYILGKEESDPSIAIMAMDRAKAQIFSVVHNRDASGPSTVRDVWGRFNRKTIYPVPKI